MDNDNLRTENNKLKAELSEMSRTVKRESSNTKNCMENVGHKNKSIESLNLQVVTLQGQNNIMAINISEKDSVLTELRDKILTVSNIKERIEGENTKLNQSILFLQHLLGQLQPIDKREHNPKVLQRESPDVEEVFILHDSLFKYVNEGLMKNEKVTGKKTFTPHLDDALRVVTSLSTTPKVIFLHTATNDLPHISEEEILSKITEIHTICRQRGKKFIWSGITPRSDDPSISAKGQLVNASIRYTLAREEETFFSWNGTSWMRGEASTNHFMKMISTSINKGRVRWLLIRVILYKALNKEELTSHKFNGNTDKNSRYRHNHKKQVVFTMV